MTMLTHIPALLRPSVGYDSLPSVLIPLTASGKEYPLNAYSRRTGRITYPVTFFDLNTRVVMRYFISRQSALALLHSLEVPQPERTLQEGRFLQKVMEQPPPPPYELPKLTPDQLQRWVAPFGIHLRNETARRIRDQVCLIFPVAMTLTQWNQAESISYGSTARAMLLNRYSHPELERSLLCANRGGLIERVAAVYILFSRHSQGDPLVSHGVFSRESYCLELPSGRMCLSSSFADQSEGAHFLQTREKIREIAGITFLQNYALYEKKPERCFFLCTEFDPIPSLRILFSAPALPLGEILKKRELLEQLTLKDKEEVAEKVMVSLRHLHAAGVLERDLEPNEVHLGVTAEGRLNPSQVALHLSYSFCAIEDHSQMMRYTGKLLHWPPEVLRYLLDRQQDLRAGPPPFGVKGNLWSAGIILHLLFGGQMPRIPAPRFGESRLLATARFIGTLSPGWHRQYMSVEELKTSWVQTLDAMLHPDPELRDFPPPEGFPVEISRAEEVKPQISSDIPSGVVAHKRSLHASLGRGFNAL